MKQDIGPEELNLRLQAHENIRIVDVRMPFEFSRGHIPGAINVPLGSITSEIPGVQREDSVVIVCQGGVRSDTACQKVEQNYQTLFNLVGGTGNWIASGLDVERSPKAARSLERQTHLVGGLLLAVAFSLQRLVNSDWIYIAMLPMFGLLFDAMTGVCLMSLILKRMPWNATGEVQSAGIGSLPLR